MNFVDVAEEWVAEGLNPLPLKKDKSPKLPIGHNFLYQPIDKLEKRFASCDKIGIACGPVSGGFYCLDFDCHDGQNITPIFDDFFENPTIQSLIEHDELIFYKTPRGGFHGYFKIDKEMPGTTFALWENGDVMIEMRGHGQYAAVFPSEGYEYVAGNDLIKLHKMDESALEWIIGLAQSFNKDPEKKEVIFGESKSDRKWPDKWDDTKVDGHFNNTQVEYSKELLRMEGWKLISTRKHDGVELWQRPGKGSDEGISATFGAKPGMFYNFSKSAKPFDAETAYSPFNIYTILKHGGDWKKAKDALRITPYVKPVEGAADASGCFPIDVFPELIRDFISELNRTLNFHVDFSAAAAMFAISTLNGNKYKLQVKQGWEAPTIFWFACVGFPGTIKTHPVKTLLRPITHIDQVSKRFWDDQMRHYNPEAKPKNKTPKPKFKQMLISDYTIEALHSIHDINKRGIGLYKDELKGFLNDMNKYRKGSDEEFWLESFNNGSYIVNRVSKDPIMINHICINMIGTIQHDVLNKVISEYAGNGLIDRFLFTSSEATVFPLTTEDIDPYFRDSWHDLLQGVNTHFKYLDSQDTELIQMTPEVFAIYQSIDKEYVALQNSDEISQEIKNYLSKMKTYVPRFALLLAIMDSICDATYIEVTETHMTNAGRIAAYFISTAKNVFLNNAMRKDISDVETNMRGLTRDEKIIKLTQKGFKHLEIYSYFSLSKASYYRILKQTGQ
jgi:hypothetical protein